MLARKMLPEELRPQTASACAALPPAPGAWAQSKFKTLHQFTGGKGGSVPAASLVFDQAGNLYGTTQYGGTQGLGVVFKMTPSTDGSWKEKVLHEFTGGDDGSNPSAGLIFGQTGNLYGTTASGGAHGGGVVFQLAPNTKGSWTESVLYSFCSLRNCGDGASPLAGLIFDAAGNLYGTTADGVWRGVVFQLTPNLDGSWTEKVLHHFTYGGDGHYPVAGMIFDQSGNLYGTTAAGGLDHRGSVFQFAPNPDGSWTEKLIYSFMGRPDGVGPDAGLIFDPTGNLYSTTSWQGGTRGGGGIVFELAPNLDGSWTESVLHRFTTGPDGGHPTAGLISDQAGNLYGTTTSGGYRSFCNGRGCGVVFKLSPNSDGSWTESALHRFVGVQGAYPSAGLIFDAAGNLYGTTAGDGTTTFGSVFEITP